MVLTVASNSGCRCWAVATIVNNSGEDGKNEWMKLVNFHLCRNFSIDILMILRASLS